MAFLSQASPLGSLLLPHDAFQEHAAHLAEWSAKLRSKGSERTCIRSCLTTFPDSTGFCGWWNDRLKTSGMVQLIPPYCEECHPAQEEVQENHPWAISISVCRLRVKRCIGRMSTTRHRIGSI